MDIESLPNMSTETVVKDVHMHLRRAHDTVITSMTGSGIANVTIAVLEACSVAISRIWAAGAVSCGGGVPHAYFFGYLLFGGCCGVRGREMSCPSRESRRKSCRPFSHDH